LLLSGSSGEEGTSEMEYVGKGGMAKGSARRLPTRQGHGENRGEGFGPLEDSIFTTSETTATEDPWKETASRLKSGKRRDLIRKGKTTQQASWGGAPHSLGV